MQTKRKQNESRKAALSGDVMSYNDQKNNKY